MTTLSVSRKQLEEGIKLDTSGPHRLVLRSQSEPTFVIDGAVFAFDSSFPGPGVLRYLEHAQALLARHEGARVMAFGHTDVRGTLSYNKGLSDRRAKAVLALLQRDAKGLDSIAQQEEWGVAQYQAMLRALGCNPGAIDGIDGPMTAEALRGFQSEYNANLYHQSPKPARLHADLVVDGKLGDKSKAALRDAYAASSPSTIPSARFNEPAFAGCSELNPVSEQDTDNRRVTLSLIRPTGPKTEEFPCKEGQISACPVDREQGLRCPFYRTHFGQSGVAPVARFFDFQWLKEQGNAAHLSALTSLPDGAAVTFRVFRWKGPITDPMPSSQTHSALPEDLGSELDSIPGEIRGGVAFARWLPPPDFDPFAHSDWLVDHDLELAAFDDDESAAAVAGEDLLQAPASEPPVFLVETADSWAFSLPPRHNLDRLRLVEASEGSGLAVGYDFGLVPWKASGGRLEPTQGLAADVGVLSVLMVQHEVTPLTNEDTTAAATA